MKAISRRDCRLGKGGRLSSASEACPGRLLRVRRFGRMGCWQRSDGLFCTHLFERGTCLGELFGNVRIIRKLLLQAFEQGHRRLEIGSSRITQSGCVLPFPQCQHGDGQIAIEDRILRMLFGQLRKDRAPPLLERADRFGPVLHDREVHLSAGERGFVFGYIRISFHQPRQCLQRLLIRMGGRFGRRLEDGVAGHAVARGELVLKGQIARIPHDELPQLGNRFCKILFGGSLIFQLPCMAGLWIAGCPQFLNPQIVVADGEIAVKFEVFAAVAESGRCEFAGPLSGHAGHRRTVALLLRPGRCSSRVGKHARS